jgi:glycosyltransferase involved in cell wall biosynthesis
MSDPKKLIVILGPHRSGTSLCTAAVESLGAELRLPTHYANPENRKGFFEHPDIVDFNDRLLSHLGGTWDNPLFDGPSAIAKTNLAEWRMRAANLFDSIFSGVQISAIKDPRLCQLLDFWVQVAFDCGFSNHNIFIVHVLRAPIEVALSQKRRSQDNAAYYEIGGQLVEGAALWFSLTAQALAQTRCLNNYFISYPKLLSKSEEQLKALADFLDLKFDKEKSREFSEHFVDVSLHRSIANPEATEFLTKAFPEVMEFDRELHKLSFNGPDLHASIEHLLQNYASPGSQLAISNAIAPAISRLSDRCRRDGLELLRQAEVIADLETQIAEHTSVVTPLRTQISRLEQGNADHEYEKASLKTELETQRKALDTQNIEMDKLRAGILQHEYTIGQMQASTSWKLTAPVRWLGTLRKRAIENIEASVSNFRLLAIYKYQRMSVRHPRFAWIGRVALRPFFRIINILIPANGGRSPKRNGEMLMPMIYQQQESLEKHQPFVSIIVPNYNHADYLALRLDSIYSQTYRNFEVILLDDSSNDDSVAVLNRYQESHAENTRLLVNAKNSGGVFHQWERGLKLARGDIIWIAESDDWCSENFLETLVPFFENEAVQLAYCKTIFMNASGSKPQWSISEYLHDIDPDRWASPIVETAYNIVADAFAIKNIIPNVSSAIFRNPGPLEILQDLYWKEMQTCGDWIFYLHLIRGGVLVYSTDACNYYRIHGENTSVKSYSEDRYYIEHECVAKTVQKFYRVDPKVFRQQRDNLIAHWRESRPDFSEDHFNECYNLDRIEQAAIERAPNLLMASYGFCTGGGETFPVELANLMKAAGYNVTYLDCAQEPRNEGVRRNLRIDIPIVSDFKQIRRIISDFGIDVIHSHHAWVDSTILDLLPEQTECKTIVTLHGMYETINNVDLKFILPRLVRRSARLIYVAEKNLSALEAHKLASEARLVRIENALSAVDFQQISRGDLGIPDDAFVLTLISRAMEEKGWREAVEIVSSARNISGKDIHLILVGDGVEYDRMRAMELPSFVHLEGFQRNVRGYFAVADAGFLPSKFRGESFPLVIIECLQAGRPFLASALGDIPYMLSSPEGSAGILVELDGAEINISAWAMIIDALASDRQTCDLLLSRVAGAARKFDSNVMAKRHDEVYRSVLCESK